MGGFRAWDFFIGFGFGVLVFRLWDLTLSA